MVVVPPVLEEEPLDGEYYRAQRELVAGKLAGENLAVVQVDEVDQ